MAPRQRLRDIIKNTVSCNFARGEDQQAVDFMEAQKMGYIRAKNRGPRANAESGQSGWKMGTLSPWTFRRVHRPASQDCEEQ